MKLSVLVPAYNEEARIGSFLKDLLKFASKRDCEVIVINDGSKDNTLSVLKKFKNKKLKIISYKKNKGKAGALKEGFKKAKGEKIIFIDADGAISPEEIPKMAELLDNFDIVVGNRLHEDSNVKRNFFRNITSFLFNLYVAILFRTKIRDNLCGFKGFNKKIGKQIFNDLISERWIFDVEIFYRARKNNFKVKDIPIKWNHVPDGSMTFFDTLKMSVELLKLRFKL